MIDFKTKGEIAEYFRVLHHEDSSFHPDIKFEDYKKDNSHERRYNDSQVTLRKTLLDKAFRFCTEHKIDIYNLYRITCIEIDVEPKLRKHFPVLFELLDKEKLDWKKINAKFSETHLKRLTDFIHGSKELIELNFFDVLTEHWKGNAGASKLLDFFKKLLEEINSNLSKSDKKKIKKTLYNLFIEFDLNYLNYIGELAVLNMFTKNKEYKLDKVESPLGNKKEADFLFTRLDGGKSVLVEVVSIRPRIFPKNHTDLKMLFESKLSEKHLSKTKGDIKFMKYFLVPVVWGTSDELIFTTEFLKSGSKIDIPNVTEICAYCTFSDIEDNNSNHRFGSLSTMFS